MTDFTLRPLTVPERKYTYAQSSQLQGQTGNIGYLRGDFGSSGDQFYTTYQINVDRDTANVCFIGMESLEKIKGTKEVNAAAYDRVYDGKMDCISLENIYQKFNVDHPADYKGRSLSVSDVVEIRESDTLNPGFYFVDSIGFKSISFDKSLCKEPVNASDGKISVLLVEPNKYPKSPKEIRAELSKTRSAMSEIGSRVSEEIYRRRADRSKDQER